MGGLTHAADWQQVSFDMLPYRGRDLVLYFETYNDSLLSGPSGGAERGRCQPVDV